MNYQNHNQQVFMKVESYPPIFRAGYALTLFIYKLVGGFNREYKFSLGEKIKLICHNLLDLIIVTNGSNDKLVFIPKLDKIMEALKTYLQIALDLGAINQQQVIELNNHLGAVGRQIGGWRKWAVNKNTNVTNIDSQSAPVRVPNA